MNQIPGPWAYQETIARQAAGSHTHAAPADVRLSTGSDMGDLTGDRSTWHHLEPSAASSLAAAPLSSHETEEPLMRNGEGWAVVGDLSSPALAGPGRGEGRHSGVAVEGEGSHGTPLAEEDTPIAAMTQAAIQAWTRGGSNMPRPAQRRTLVVANQKGGVGKTTTTVNLAASLAAHGSTVLVVDLDPQGNASTALGVDHYSGTPSVYDVIIEGQPLDSVVQPCEAMDNLYCAPATIDLAGAEIELVSLAARESRLRKAVQAYDAAVDYIFIDCPPSLGLLTINALVAADELLIPIQCEYYALEGLGQLLRNVDLVKAHLNRQLDVSTILLTMYDGRTRLAAQVADEVREHFPEVVLNATIPRSVRISEAPSYGQTVMTYDPTSSGALAYLSAAREIAERGTRRSPKNKATRTDSARDDGLAHEIPAQPTERSSPMSSSWDDSALSMPRHGKGTGSAGGEGSL